MKKLLLILVLFGLIFSSCDAQRNYTAKKLLFSQVQKPYINYGYLYNWWAVIDSRNIAASGWHVPIQTDYETLFNLLGTRSSNIWTPAGDKLREISSIYWGIITNSTNEVFFNARGSGERNTLGSFLNLRATCHLRTSTINNSTTSIIFNITTSSGAGFNASQHTIGYSIRLVKNTTTLTHGQTGTYVGNDGKIYRTIAIGSPAQEWLADNLAETLYRDLSTITVVTDNAVWAALTTEARCVYNNDESYR